MQESTVTIEEVEDEVVDLIGMDGEREAIRIKEEEVMVK